MNKVKFIVVGMESGNRYSEYDTYEEAEQEALTGYFLEDVTVMKVFIRRI